MTEFLDMCVAGTNIAPTILLGVVLVYWLLVITGGLGLDFLDLDLDVDADIDVDADMDVGDMPGDASSILGTGVVVLRFLNIGRVPLMFWVSAFTLSLWALTMFLDKPENHATLGHDLLILLRNGVLAMGCAKLITQPLQGKFDPVEAPSVRELIGQTCTVVTPTVTSETGQVRYATEAAPLLLNARTKGEPLAKGDLAVIVEIDMSKAIYFVEKSEHEDQS